MRVFITGLGAITASGETARQNWESVKQGVSGIAEIDHWDLKNWPTKLAGQLKNIQPAKLLPDKKLMKALSRQDLPGIHAAIQAIGHSGLIEYRDSLPSVEKFNDETGIYVSSPGNKFYQQYDFLPLLAKTKGSMDAFAKNLFDEVHPMWLLRILPNNVLAYAGITFGFKGPNHNFTNHAAGSLQAVLEAWHAIRSGQAKRAVVVGYDLSFEPQSLFYYANLGLLSTKALKPFDKAHDGTILAEGAAALVLESEESVRERNATCYGEMKGGLSASENAGLFGLKKEGEPLATLISETLHQAELKPGDINLVVAHGNGNPGSDDSEARAFTKVFTEKMPLVTAFKWAMGHTICASGLIDAVLMSYALSEKCAPGIPNLDEPSEEAEPLALSREIRSLDAKAHGLIINRGFGSMNATLVIKACG